MEFINLITLLIPIILFGIYPNIILDTLHVGITQLLYLINFNSYSLNTEDITCFNSLLPFLITTKNQNVIKNLILFLFFYIILLINYYNIILICIYKSLLFVLYIIYKYLPKLTLLSLLKLIFILFLITFNIYIIINENKIKKSYTQEYKQAGILDNGTINQ